MADGDTLVNAVLGAVVSVLGSVAVPFAPLVGGAVAGYLESGTRSEGLWVGLLSGLIALVPCALLVVLVGGIFSSFLLGVVPGADGLALGLLSVSFLTFVALVGAVTVVGLSTLGGWVGTYIRHDANIDL